MKRWYQWFYLSLGFAAGGILSYCNGKSITPSLMSVAVFLILGLIQFLCEKKGEKGKKVFKYISVAVIILLVLWVLFLFGTLGDNASTN